MAVIIFAPEETVSRPLLEYCRESGFKEVLIYNCLDSMLREFRDIQKPELVIFTWSPETDALVYELTVREKLDPSFSVVPIIQILPYRPLFDLFSSAAKRKTAYNRIDEYLIRPFNLSIFKNAVQAAHESRVMERNTLLVLGTEFREPLLELVWSHKTEAHYTWKNILFARNEKELAIRISDHSEKLGAIIVGSDGLFDGATELLSQFRKKSVGNLAPIMTLSHDAAFVKQTKTLSNVFINLNQTTLLSALDLLTKRVTKQWMVQMLLSKSKDAQKTEYSISGEHKVQSRWDSFISKTSRSLHYLNFALSIDPSRWEVHESLGRYYMEQQKIGLAVHHFRQTLKTNPCAPRAHLSLIELLKDSPLEKELCLIEAKKYCENLPQIKEQIQKWSKSA